MIFFIKVFYRRENAAPRKAFDSTISRKGRENFVDRIKLVKKFTLLLRIKQMTRKVLFNGVRK